MMVGGYMFTYTTGDADLFLPIPVPDLRTGVGHGHFRPLNRELPKKDKLKGDAPNV